MVIQAVVVAATAAASAVKMRWSDNMSDFKTEVAHAICSRCHDVKQEALYTAHHHKGAPAEGQTAPVGRVGECMHMGALG